MSDNFDHVKDVNIVCATLAIAASTFMMVNGKKQFWQFASIAFADLLYVFNYLSQRFK